MKPRKRWPNRKSVILTWLGSYIAVLFVPILFSLTVYWVAEDTIENRIRESNRLILLQMKDSFDNQIDSIKRLTSQVYANATLQALFYSHKFERGEYRYDLFQLTRELRALKSTYPAFYEFYVYWAAADLGILPSTYKAGSLLHADLYRKGKLGLEEWKLLVSAAHFRHIVLTNRMDEQGNEQHFINYVSSLPSSNAGTPAGSVVVMMDAQQLFRTIGNVKELNESEVAILNEQNQNLSAGSAWLDLPIRREQLAGSSGNLERRFQDKDYQLSYIASDNSGLVYVVMTPNRIIWQEVAHLRYLIVACIAFSIAAGTALTVVFLRRDYKPLQGLLSALALRSNPYAGQQAGNEFQFIQQAVSAALDEQEKIQLRLRQQQNQLQSNFISRLLKGKPAAGMSEQDGFAAFGLPAVSDRFCVLLVYLEESDQFFDMNRKMAAHEQLHLLHFVVANVFEDVFNRKQRAWMTEVDDLMACLINLPPPDDAASHPGEELRRTTEEAQQFLRSKFGVEITAALSGVHPLPNVAVGYKEALSAMEYRLIMGKGGIIAFDGLPVRTPDRERERYDFPIQTEQKWINWIKAGQADEALRILDELMERNFRRATLPVEWTKCFVFDIVSALIKAIQDIRSMQDDVPFLPAEAIERVLSAATVDEIELRLKAVIMDVCEYAAELQERSKIRSRQGELASFIGKIVEFVDRNYADFNLNISFIGEYFDMKPTYVSKLFKDQTGESLLEYISRYRIEKSKLLLNDQNRSLLEVARQCGFVELKTFNRTFKKLEGVTPGKYKTMK